MERIEKRLIEAQHALMVETSKAVRELSDKVEFSDFSIEWQPSDGFVLEYETKNAPLSSCIEVIKNKGKLSLEDYLNICI